MRFKDIKPYGDGDIIQAMEQLEIPFPTEEELARVSDRNSFPSLYTAVDALTEYSRYDWDNWDDEF